MSFMALFHVRYEIVLMFFLSMSLMCCHCQPTTEIHLRIIDGTLGGHCFMARRAASLALVLVCDDLTRISDLEE